MARLRQQGHSVRQIAAALDRSPLTVVKITATVQGGTVRDARKAGRLKSNHVRRRGESRGVGSVSCKLTTCPSAAGESKGVGSVYSRPFCRRDFTLTPRLRGGRL